MTTEPTSIKQKSLEELHRLNITLSNYFAVTPTIVNDFTPLSPIPAEDKTTEATTREDNIIV